MTFSKMTGGSSQMMILQTEHREQNPFGLGIICAICCQILIGALIGGLMVLVAIYAFTNCSLEFKLKTVNRTVREDARGGFMEGEASEEDGPANPSSEDGGAVDPAEPLKGLHGNARTSATRARSLRTQPPRTNPAQPKPSGRARHGASG